MKNLVKSLIVLATITVTSNVSADFFDDLVPVIGADYYLVWRLPNNNLNNILPKTYPGATLYIGGKFSEFGGFEIGYDISARKTKNWVIPAGTSVGGVTVNRTIYGSTSARYMGGHFDLIGYLPIDCVIKDFELFGALGYGNVSGIRIGVGGNYMLTKIIGVRVKLGYENAANMNANDDIFYTTNLGFPSRPYRHATSLSLGAFFKF